MTKTIHLSAKDVPAHLRIDNCRRFEVVLTDEVTVPADAGVWSGGTRALFSALRLSDGALASVTDTFRPPWSAERRAHVVKLRPGYGVLESGHFMGKATAPRFYIHPDDAFPALLGPAVELSDAERKVLKTISNYKPAYRADEYRRQGVPADLAEAAKQRLRELGLLTQAGAITPAGRNAL